ncbi:MAG: hypothetical protein H0T46_25755 [Deltaproteobacteria bacterium]|nr:hypothetical protein [Deltaproteobacteria bacterium]
MRSWWVVVALLVGCDESSRGPHVVMDPSRRTSFFDAPFPDDGLRSGSGVDVSGFPNPGATPSVETIRGLLADNDGFALSGGVFFQISDPLDRSLLPSIDASIGDESPTFVIDLETGVRSPLEVSFVEEPSQYSAPNLLTLLPVQGIPLRPATRYAAVVTTELRTATGEPLSPATAGEKARWSAQIEALESHGVDVTQIAGLTVFSTGDPAAQLARVRTAVLARPLPVIDAPFARTELFADYCVYETTIKMPDYQSGTPPFETSGGTWQYDATGAPILQRTSTSTFVVTIPRRAQPTAGYPLVVFVRAGGGGDRPLVDRGQHAVAGGAAIEPGEGPARYLARAGFAGLQVDGPLGGRRNVTMGDEQFLLFNVSNIAAMRDNVRENALELDVIAHVATKLHLDASDCPGAAAADVTFDDEHFALMGHSNGAWISPLAAAHEPLFGALILSGAGGSWIANILHKKKPLAPYGVIASLLRVFELRADEPIMTFAQWALEPADPQVYGASILPRHVLITQGMVDNYILPRIANATNLSMGLDLAGPELDRASDPRLAEQLPLGPLLPLIGRRVIGLPATANVSFSNISATAVVVQRPEDGIEDGHEAFFQTDAPKHAYQCFLASWVATGTPTVPVDAPRDAPCP